MFRFFGYLILVSGIYNHKVGYTKKGSWYEPAGTTYGSFQKSGALNVDPIYCDSASQWGEL